MSDLVEGGLYVRCCACSGEVTFVKPKSSSDQPTLFHTLPYCDRFDSVSTPDALVAYLRDCGNARRN